MLTCELKNYSKNKSVYYVFALFLFVPLLTTSCSLNKAFRPNCYNCAKDNTESSYRHVEACPSSSGRCEDKYIVKFDDENTDHYLTFVEFTDRGNLFSRRAFLDVLSFIKDVVKEEKKLAIEEKDEEKRKNMGVDVVVYVHGWHHNAHSRDKNLLNFKEILKKANGLNENRTLIGVYVGWRGRIFQPILGVNWLDWPDYASYWDRDKVAQDIGKGGVTELLLRLEQILKGESELDTVLKNQKKLQQLLSEYKDLAEEAGDQRYKKTLNQALKGQESTKQILDEKRRKNYISRNKNQLLITGHSMGASILLSSLNEIFLQRIVEKGPDSLARTPDAENKKECIVTEPFAHGVVLLNPAISANEILQLKELVAGVEFCKDKQDRFMHIISSDADKAASVYRWAQYFGGFIFDSHKTLKRNLGIGRKEISLKEAQLATTTVGDYKFYWTGILESPENLAAKIQNEDEEYNFVEKDDCIIKGERWSYIDLKRADCFFKYSGQENNHHIQVKSNDPLSFIFTDGAFIENHNDIFNDNVVAYLLAIMAEARHARSAEFEGADLHAFGPEQCTSTDFHFGNCFGAYQEIWEKQE